MASFFEALEARCKAVDSLLCVGLDPHKTELGDDPSADGAAEFCLRLIEATSPVAAAYKPNAAFFEVFGAAGATALSRVIAAIPDGIPVLLDAKRGDIGSTAAAYASAAFDEVKVSTLTELGSTACHRHRRRQRRLKLIAHVGLPQATGITVNPYMGGDSLEPFLKDGTKGAFVLCKTSNPGSNEVQTLKLASGESVFEAVAKRAESEWNANNNLGLVVGATDTDALKRARAAAPSLWILAPGVGFQGGDLATTIATSLRPDGMGILLPVSRGISRDADPAAAAVKLRDAINVAKAAAMAKPDAGLDPGTALAPYQAEFIEMAMGLGVLKFGSFTLKSGRVSPYFFNAGLFRTGSSLARLGQYYAKAIEASGIPFDVLFGPAYKGIPLVSGVAIAMAGLGRDIEFAYNRKEAKDHGEGGLLVGADVADKQCLLIDDVISAGTAVREAVGILKGASALLAGVVISVDRQEKTGAAGAGDMSATQQVQKDLGVPVVSIVTLTHLLEWAKGREDMAEYLEAIATYRATYGVTD
jgi:uridine monophosphate synthetase